MIYYAKKDLDKSLEYLYEALKIDLEIGYNQGKAENLENIGVIYRDKGNLDQALKYFAESLGIYQEIGLKQPECVKHFRTLRVCN